MSRSYPQHSTRVPLFMGSGCTPRASRAFLARRRMYIDGVFSRVHTKKLSSCYPSASWQVDPTAY